MKQVIVIVRKYCMCTEIVFFINFTFKQSPLEISIGLILVLHLKTVACDYLKEQAHSHVTHEIMFNLI